VEEVSAVAFVVGCILLVVGVWLFSPALALIVAGALLIAMAVLFVRGADRSAS
jgi:uncharacterized membrane protein